MAQPGDLVGWVSLLRRSPSEWVTAASPLKLIAIPSEHFYELENNSDAFRHWLDNSNSPSELITVLKHPLRARPTAEPNEREVMRRLIPSMRLIPARHTRDLQKHPDILHLWNCVPQGFSFSLVPLLIMKYSIKYPLVYLYVFLRLTVNTGSLSCDLLW